MADLLVVLGSFFTTTDIDMTKCIYVSLRFQRYPIPFCHLMC